jgi:hypothetical protein
VQFHRQHLLNALQFGLVHIEILAFAQVIRFAGEGREILAELCEQPTKEPKSEASASGRAGDLSKGVHLHNGPRKKAGPVASHRKAHPRSGALAASTIPARNPPK